MYQAPGFIGVILDSHLRRFLIHVVTKMVVTNFTRGKWQQIAQKHILSSRDYMLFVRE